MSFTDNFPDVLVMSALGDDITYVCSNGADLKQIKCILELNVQVGEYVSETQHQVEILKELLPFSIQAEDIIISGLDSYRLKVKLIDDGKYERWSLKNE